MNKDIKTFEEWKADRDARQATASGYLTIILLALILVAILASCSVSRVSRRDIKRAMSYSTSDYSQPRVKSNLGKYYGDLK